MSESIDTESIPDVKIIPPKRRQLKVSDGAIYFQSLVDNAAKVVFKTRLRLVLFVGILMIEMLIIYWSLAIRLPVINNNLSLLSQQIQLNLQRQSQQIKLTADDFNQIAKDISLAEAKIFNNVGELADWLIEQSAYANSLSINMTYLIEEASQLSLKNTFSLPIEIKLDIEHPNSESPYTKMLEFTQHMIKGHRHLEILGTEVSTNDHGITAFTLSINLWVTDSTDMLKASESSTTSSHQEGMDVPFTQ